MRVSPSFTFDSIAPVARRYTLAAPDSRPAHCFVAENAGDVLGKIAIREPWYRTEVGGRGAVFEIGSEAKHVGLGLQRLHGEFVGSSLDRLDRPATELLDRLG